MPFGGPAAGRLEELRAAAVELSAEAALRLGEPDVELDALEALLAAEPLRESAAAVLARCLHAAVRVRRGETRVAELAPLGAADQLAATVLAAVSTTEIVSRIPDEADTTTRLLAALSGRDMLLVLDNCEHLVDAAAHFVETLLERLPGLRVLATSREPLAVPGEVLHPVDALVDDDAVRGGVEAGGHPDQQPGIRDGDGELARRIGRGCRAGNEPGDERGHRRQVRRAQGPHVQALTADLGLQRGGGAGSDDPAVVEHDEVVGEPACPSPSWGCGCRRWTTCS